jgi:hypothetical protein
VPNDAQKTWFGLTLNEFGRKKAAEAIQLLGKALPCSVAAVPVDGVPIVTVKFEVNAAPFTIPNVTCPMFGPEWVRYPVPVGTKGVVFPADAYLGGVSGLGDGVAQLGVIPGNLSALVFFPIGNSGLAASESPNSLVLYGPDGVVIRNADKTCKITLGATGIVMDMPLGMPVTINGNTIVNGNLQISGTIQAEDGGIYAGNIATQGEVIAHAGAGAVNLSTHTHTQPNDSHGDAEQPTAAPTAGT